ncbi:MAG TPA: hypothetical protein VL572_02415 [Pyrinomonadaceae bacterium]|nr:hypothetical protein [Pyrinomonadaceae bacterium]
MFRLYEKGYKIGFVLNLCIFAVVNVVEYIKASDEHSGSKFRMISGARGFPAWGFPFDWSGNYLGYVQNGAILKFIAIVACVL